MPSGRAEALARVGAIVEEPRFHRYLTGRENMKIVAAAREPEAHARIDGALARVVLTKRADERVGAYSLGMRQRLGVARALLGDPELLILDEPMNGLDPAGMEEFRFMIRGLVEVGRTVVLSSHLLDEVEKTCDAIAGGDALLAPTVTRRLLDRFAASLPAGSTPPSLDTLTAREVEILRRSRPGTRTRRSQASSSSAKRR
jgi:ABC-type multidrug transport system ATPase subunit